MSHVAYIHARPSAEDASGIFYVGKGTDKRAHNFEPRNPHYANIVKKHKTILVGAIECSSEQVAFELEVGLIVLLKKHGVNLANKTDGGEGMSGYEWSQESRSKISGDNHWSRRNPEKVKHGEAHPNHGRITSEETKKKISAAISGEKHGMFGKGYKLSGEKHPRFGKSCPENVKEATRIANTGRQAWNKGVSHIGVPHSDEAKNKIRAAKLGRKFITNGIETKCLPASQAILLLDLGWKYGKLNLTKTN